MMLRSSYFARIAKNFRGELLLDGVRGNFFDGGEWPLFIFDGGGISLMLYLHPIKKNLTVNTQNVTPEDATTPFVQKAIALNLLKDAKNTQKDVA